MTQVAYNDAQAYASWAGKALPTEAELGRRRGRRHARRKDLPWNPQTHRPTLTLRAPRARAPWELDAVHFPRPATRYWTEMHPEPFKRGFSEFTRFYGMLLDGAASIRYVNGFVYSTMVPVDRAGDPGALRSGRRRSSSASSGASSCATGTRSSSPRRSRPTASCRRSIPMRSPTTSWPRTSTRCRDHHSRDDLPAHALHRRGDAPDRRLPRARGRLDRTFRRPSCSA